MLKKIFILVIVIFMGKKSLSQSDKSYVSLSINKISKVEFEKELLLVRSFQIEYNKALVNIYNDNTAIIFPASGTGEGMYFTNLETMQKIIGMKTFPVKGDGSFWEKEKQRLIKLDQFIPYYLEELSKIIGFNIQISFDKKYLKEVSKHINLYLNSSKINKNSYYYIAIFISELIRRSNNGVWKLIPIYTLNIYYIPEIVFNHSYCHPWSIIIRSLEISKIRPINIEQLVEYAGVFTIFQSREYLDDSISD